MLLLLLILIIILFYFTSTAFSSMKRETFLSEAPINSTEQKKENMIVIDTASQFLKHHSVLDKSIHSIFPDYTRPKDYPTTRTNFDQIDLYISNAPNGMSFNSHKE